MSQGDDVTNVWATWAACVVVGPCWYKDLKWNQELQTMKIHTSLSTWRTTWELHIKYVFICCKPIILQSCRVNLVKVCILPQTMTFSQTWTVGRKRHMAETSSGRASLKGGHTERPLIFAQLLDVWWFLSQPHSPSNQSVSPSNHSLLGKKMYSSTDGWLFAVARYSDKWYMVLHQIGHP